MRPRGEETATFTYRLYNSSLLNSFLLPTRSLFSVYSSPLAHIFTSSLSLSTPTSSHPLLSYPSSSRIPSSHHTRFLPSHTLPHFQSNSFYSTHFLFFTHPLPLLTHPSHPSPPSPVIRYSPVKEKKKPLK